jgi:transcriptional regulator with XRE-family HTH domain
VSPSVPWSSGPIGKLRVARKLSQKEMALALGWTSNGAYQRVSAIESGSLLPADSVIQNMARILGLGYPQMKKMVVDLWWARCLKTHKKKTR